MVEQLQLGASDIAVSPLGLGCWQFSGGRGLAGRYWEALPSEVEEDIVRLALDGGVNWFDTAEVYGWGTSESALSRSLRRLGRKSGDVVIATKWWPLFRFAGHIRKSIAERLHRLDGFDIDLYQVHQPYSFSSVAAQMNAMADLVEAGKIRVIGVSNFSARAMEKAFKVLAGRDLPLVSNQMRYSLLDRAIEANGVLDAARDLGITIIAHSPLAQGILSGRFHDDPSHVARLTGPRKRLAAFSRRGLERTRPLVEALREIATQYDATPSQVALNWLIHVHGDTVVAIPGASRVSQMEDNLGALRFALSQEHLARLDQLSSQFKA
ncbi:MAG: aldo/keto reductase [Gemmatimonas sp. SM23_52]|nr:MAG: aldo/keto reductase [Gemmatimonas sp. SM23_52]